VTIDLTAALPRQKASGLRSSTIACRRLRSVGLRWTLTPVRIRQTRTTETATESLSGLLCRHQSTSDPGGRALGLFEFRRRFVHPPTGCLARLALTRRCSSERHPLAFHRALDGWRCRPLPHAPIPDERTAIAAVAGVTASAASDTARGSLARRLRRRQYEAEPGAAMDGRIVYSNMAAMRLDNGSGDSKTYSHAPIFGCEKTIE
jgi:hypothetical protein